MFMHKIDIIRIGRLIFFVALYFKVSIKSIVPFAPRKNYKVLKQ